LGPRPRPKNLTPGARTSKSSFCNDTLIQKIFDMQSNGVFNAQGLICKWSTIPSITDTKQYVRSSVTFKFCAHTVGSNKKNSLKSSAFWLRTVPHGQGLWTQGQRHCCFSVRCLKDKAKSLRTHHCIYTMSGKKNHFFDVPIFAKYYRIFKILSPMHSVGNWQ